MGDGHIQRFVRGLQLRLILSLVIVSLVVLSVQWSLDYFTSLNSVVSTIITGFTGIIIACIYGAILGSKLAKPTVFLSQAILHISPSEHLVAAPNIDSLRYGQQLVSTLVRQVYDFATIAEQHTPAADTSHNNLLDQLPVAVIGVDSQNVITLANSKAKTTIKLDTLVGQQFKDTLQLQSDDQTGIAEWVEQSRANSLTATQLWQKVEIKNINNESLGYFDIAASFNRDSASGTEVMLSLYDHSDAYGEEESSISFIALAVHELRTPVTILRAYIDTFEDELGEGATPQIKDDLAKMNASAEGLSSFVSNILNVARINQGQLSLKLEEGSWNEALPQIIDNLRNRANAYGKVLELKMQPQMPTVAIDRMTITEVVTNLIDNAIKYTPDNQPNITITSQINNDGLIETTVTDHGYGIPSSVMPNLFTKFYRNHRNRTTIGGTGLGLFLSKAIMSAHHGNIWASSKENEGSTFGFTLVPYSQLAAELQNADTNGITRGSHGWIKNHSMQRR